MIVMIYLIKNIIYRSKLGEPFASLNKFFEGSDHKKNLLFHFEPIFERVC